MLLLDYAVADLNNHFILPAPPQKINLDMYTVKVSAHIHLSSLQGAG